MILFVLRVSSARRTHCNCTASIACNESIVFSHMRWRHCRLSTRSALSSLRRACARLDQIWYCIKRQRRGRTDLIPRRDMHALRSF